MLELQYLATGMSDTQVAQQDELLRRQALAAAFVVDVFANDDAEARMFRSMIFGELQS